MLFKLIGEKLHLIQHPEDILYKETLKRLLDEGITPTWRDKARKLFTKLLSRIALEEKLTPFDNDEDELLFKHHLPDFIAGIIQTLEEILFAPRNPFQEKENYETVIHLLLRLFEWTVWNYEAGRCIYGIKNAQKAESLFNISSFEVEVWGDRDEVWLTTLEILENDFSMRGLFDHAETYYSCKTYGSIIRKLPSEIADNPRNWTGPGKTHSPILIIGIQIKIIDHSKVRMMLTDLKNPSLKSSGRLENTILSEIAASCGTPTTQRLLQ